MTRYIGLLNSHPGNPDPIMQHVYQPARLKTDLQRRSLIDFLAVRVFIHIMLNDRPVLLAELLDSFLIRVEIVAFVLVRHLEDFMGGVPILADSNEMIDFKVDSWDVHAVDQTWFVRTGNVLLQQGKCALQAFIESPHAAQVMMRERRAVV